MKPEAVAAGMTRPACFAPPPACAAAPPRRATNKSASASRYLPNGRPARCHAMVDVCFPSPSVIHLLPLGFLRFAVQ
jgi:hypothetical protein